MIIVLNEFNTFDAFDIHFLFKPVWNLILHRNFHRDFQMLSRIDLRAPEENQSDRV